MIYLRIFGSDGSAYVDFRIIHYTSTSPPPCWMASLLYVTLNMRFLKNLCALEICVDVIPIVHKQDKIDTT